MDQSQSLKMKDLIPELKRIAGDDYVLDDQADLLVYEYDGSIDRGNPVVVVLPDTAKEISQVLKLARLNSIPVVARGAGTGLSGGAIAEHGGIVLSMARMNQILEVNRSDRYAVVEPGVVNLDLSTHVASEGLYYAPDPSSQRACTIGGNIAENSGGPHCLAYGVTTNHVLGMEVVLADGSITWFGDNERDGIGYDLRGITIGSEGTLAIVTKISVRLLRLPEHVKTMLMSFETIEDASAAVTGIIGAGMVPAALEMMDHFCIKAANLLHAGDGNLHPSILFDERKPGDVENILAIGAEILRICVDSGGVLSGEHGIGLEKQDQMPLMFSEEDMATMSLLKLAFETEDLLNPGKVFPTGAGCGDISQARAIARVGPGAYI